MQFLLRSQSCWLVPHFAAYQHRDLSGISTPLKFRYSSLSKTTLSGSLSTSSRYPLEIRDPPSLCFLSYRYLCLNNRCQQIQRSFDNPQLACRSELLAFAESYSLLMASSLSSKPFARCCPPGKVFSCWSPQSCPLLPLPSKSLSCFKRK